MPGRRRYLAALVVSGRSAIEIDGLRRSLGSRDLLRIAAHVTIVPPLNVAESEIDEVTELLRRVASATSPFSVRVGPAAVFADRSDVVYLRVRGELAEMENLRSQISTGPLRPPTSRREREFIPHVTLSSKLDAKRSSAALVACADFMVDHRFESIELMEQDVDDPTRPWNTVAQFPFENTVVVGRGGREIELSFGAHLDPVARQFYEAEWSDYLADAYGHHLAHPEPFAFTARHDGEVVGIATGSVLGRTWDLERLVVAAFRRNEGIGGQLLRRIERIVEERGGERIRLITRQDGRARALYESHGYRSVARLPNWREGHGFVVMERVVHVASGA